jgi:hypothetical protein
LDNSNAVTAAALFGIGFESIDRRCSPSEPKHRLADLSGSDESDGGCAVEQFVKIGYGARSFLPSWSVIPQLLG